MKDIYELLNQVEVDESEISEVEVSEYEKKILKKNLLNKVKRRKINKAVAAAIIVFFITGGLGAIGIINPAFAKDIPVIGDIFKLIRDCYYRGAMVEAYNEYGNYSDNINLAQESNGVKITIKDSVFDGKTIFYTYELESNKELGEDIYPINFIKLDGEDSIIPCENQRLQQISKDIYIGQSKINLEQEINEIKFNLKFKEIDNLETKKEVKGNWSFDISLKAVENVKENINKSIENQGVKLKIESIEKTPMSIKINYNQFLSDELINKWSNINPVLSIRDDVGNYYRCEENSNHYTMAQNNMNYCDMIGKIDDNATKLIITPVIELYNETSFDENKILMEKESTLSKNEPKTNTIVFKNDIIIDLK